MNVLLWMHFQKQNLPKVLYETLLFIAMKTLLLQ